MARQEMICKSCRHRKGVHAGNGCAHTYVNGQTCPCRVTRSPRDLNQYEMGEPLND